jgi:parallel beta-helix repeat protein
MVLRVLKIRRTVRFATCLVGLAAALVYISSFGVLRAAGRVYYVATSGSDAAAGTQAQPFRTVNKGVSVLTPGDTLLIQPGTYAEALNNSVPGGTSWSAPVIVKAADPSNRPVLRPSSNTGSVLYIQNADRQYIIFDGIVFDGANVSADASKITSGPTHIRLMNSEFMNAGANGILFSHTSDHEILNCSIHDNGADVGGHGLYIAASRVTVDGTEVYRNNEWGVHVYNGLYPSEASDGNMIRNSRIHDNGGFAHNVADSLRGKGMLLGSGSGNTAYNNLVYNNYETGIQVGDHASNTVVSNNTVYRNAISSAIVSGGWINGIYVMGDSTNAIIQNNTTYGNGVDAIANLGSGTTLRNNLIGTNPMFVNPNTGDFRLQTGSPAIDAGTTVASVTSDISGVPRPQGGAYDIGAYEYTTGAPSVPAPPAAPVSLRIIR